MIDVVRQLQDWLGAGNRPVAGATLAVVFPDKTALFSAVRLLELDFQLPGRPVTIQSDEAGVYRVEILGTRVILCDKSHL